MMASLDSTDRERIQRGLMRYWSMTREVIGVPAIDKDDLLAAVAATDGWIDANQASFNSALPLAARTSLDNVQKTLLFCCVAAMRVSPTVANLLRRLLGVEVD